MDGIVDLSGLLEKVKRALSIDDNDLSQDDYLIDLINAEVRVALRRTGRTAIDDAIVTIVDDEEVVTYERNHALEDAIVKNVALKYDDMNAPIDHTIYFQFNDTPMIG
jgi:hypothetical protein